MKRKLIAFLAILTPILFLQSRAISVESSKIRKSIPVSHEVLPQDPTVVVNPRVTNGHYTYHDGATIHCEFSAGEIKRIGTDTQGHHYLESSEPWPGPDTFNAKDYNPVGKADYGYNVDHPQTPWVVDFGGKYRRDPVTGRIRHFPHKKKMHGTQQK